MATPELVAERAVRARLAGSRVPKQQNEAPKQTDNVIEFDPKGAEHRPPEETSPPSLMQRPRGFVYDGVRAGRAVRAGLSRRSAASRPLPMEKVCFYVKPVYHSELRRQADPDDKRAWLRLVGVGVVALLVVVATHAPRTLLRQAGYRLEKLQQQHLALAEINEQLKVRQAMMSDLQRVTELAAQRGLASTPPERFAWQDRTIPPVGSSELAQNQGKSRP